MAAAQRHLADCQACRLAVHQQESLKSRMSAVGAPELPAGLHASLCRLPGADLRGESLWSRLRHSRPARLGVVLIGASLVVTCIAYAIGGVREEVGDRVTPASESYTSDFTSADVRLASAPSAAELSDATLQRLDAQGWPCHEWLGDMQRTRAVLLDEGQVVSLTYANDTHRLDLFEQNGALDASGLRGFEQRTIGGAPVWVRAGIPTVATWADDGVVYTVVTDVDRDRLASVIAELPTPAPESGPVGRIGHGLDRMATWLSPAA